MKMKTFAQRYWMLWEEARDADHKITREKFAKNMGVSPGQSNGWLRNTSEPDCKTLGIIAEHAKVSVNWLIGISNVREPEKICPLMKGLPTEAVDEVVEFIKYLRFKYNFDKYKL